MTGKVEYTCDYCGETFHRYPSKVTDGRKFCDSNCYGQFKSENLNPEDLPWYEGGKTTTCNTCGEEITVYGERRRELDHNFCDHECYGKFERTDNDRQYYGPKWAKQRTIALEKSEGVCIYDGCGREESRNGRELDLHHIIPLSEFNSFAEANRPSNLVPVCAEHHGKIENKPPEYFNQ
jgi:hypothetical protein